MPVRTIAPSSITSGRSERSDFNRLEWFVIAIGAWDENIPLHWSPIGRCLLTSRRKGPPSVTAPCLETLRRTASIARAHGWGLPAVEVGAFLRSGWSEAQLERLIESVFPDAPFTDEWPPCEAVGGSRYGDHRSEAPITVEFIS